MAKEKLLILKQADIKNNCPECFHNELGITFFQKQKFGRLVCRTTNEVSSEIKCKKCFSLIYPVKWTDDIERSFNYYQKLAAPKKSSLKFTSLFYILITLFIVLIAVGIYLYTQKVIAF